MYPENNRNIRHPNIYLIHSIYLTLFSYLNIITFIAQKQQYDHTNTLYLGSIYLSIVLILIDSFLCALFNVTSLIIYNILYISCLINTIYAYGNLLSIILFIFESLNVSSDWFILNLQYPQTSQKSIQTQIYNLGIIIYVIISKVVVVPIVLILIFYKLSNNHAEPLFIMCFCLYCANLIRIVDSFIYNPVISKYLKQFNEFVIKTQED